MTLPVNLTCHTIKALFLTIRLHTENTTRHFYHMAARTALVLLV